MSLSSKTKTKLMHRKVMEVITDAVPVQRLCPSELLGLILALAECCGAAIGIFRCKAEYARGEEGNELPDEIIEKMDTDMIQTIIKAITDKANVGYEETEKIIMDLEERT